MPTLTANQAFVSVTQIQPLALAPSPLLATPARRTLLAQPNLVQHKASATACRLAQSAQLPPSVGSTMATNVRQS